MIRKYIFRDSGTTVLLTNHHKSWASLEYSHRKDFSKGQKIVYLLSTPMGADYIARLVKRREILIFPRKAGNTDNSREILVTPGNYTYWEIGPYPSRKLKIYFMIVITTYAKQNNNYTAFKVSFL